MTPRNTRQNEHLRYEAQQRILQAALAQFGETGFAAATMRQIATRAGVSQGLAYHYYAGKDALLVALFEQSMADVQTSFMLAEEEMPSPARIASLVRNAMDIVLANEEFWRVLYCIRMERSVSEGLRPVLAAWTSGIVGQLTQLLTEAGVAAAEIEARMLFAVIDGACQHMLLEPDTYPRQAMIDAIVRRFCPDAALETDP